MTNLYLQQNYLNPSRYISGRIIEYDLKAANISSLRSGNFISQEDYEYLSNLPKIQREVEIGLRIKRDKSVYDNIQKGIKGAKKLLIESNNISDDNIVRIANDAVYVNSVIDLPYTIFGNYLKFVKKSEANVFVNLGSPILFLGFREDGNINVDFKNINQDILYLHEDYMINTIVTTVVLIERSSIYEAINYITNICNQYVSLQLPLGFYREFNNQSSYRIKNIAVPFGSTDAQFGIQTLSENDKQYIDINYNYTILRELFSIVLELYTMQVH